jgi:hypothetical protein
MSMESSVPCRAGMLDILPLIEQRLLLRIPRQQEIRSTLLIFREMFQLLLDRKTLN